MVKRREASWRRPKARGGPCTQIGSALNRLEAARNLQNNDIVNLNSSKSTITDTDIASESAKLAHNQILQQVSASLFSQANGINGNLALRLLAI